MKNTTRAAILSATLAAAFPAALSAADIEVGVLTCDLTGERNLVVYSTETFDCTYNPTKGDTETYTGLIKEIGVDLEIKEGQKLIWSVIAPSDGAAPGALAGIYAGASASASVSVGVGGKILVGGSTKSFTLQPISVAGSTGFGADVGVQSLELTAK
jgi:hypothetical protein